MKTMGKTSRARPPYSPDDLTNVLSHFLNRLNSLLFSGCCILQLEVNNEVTLFSPVFIFFISSRSNRFTCYSIIIFRLWLYIYRCREKVCCLSIEPKALSSHEKTHDHTYSNLPIPFSSVIFTMISGENM